MRKGIIKLIFETEEQIEIGNSSAPGDDNLYQELAIRLLSDDHNYECKHKPCVLREDCDSIKLIIHNIKDVIFRCPIVTK